MGGDGMRPQEQSGFVSRLTAFPFLSSRPGAFWIEPCKPAVFPQGAGPRLLPLQIPQRHPALITLC